MTTGLQQHPRTLAGALALFVACSMFIACTSNVPSGPIDLGSSHEPVCNDPWQATGSMAEARYMATTTRLSCPSTAPGCSWDGMVLVAGGVGEFTLGSAERYDPATGTWSAAGTLRYPRNSHQAVGLQDGRVLVVGGVTDTGSPTETAEIYNPATNAWSDAASMSTDRFIHQLILLSDGRVLAFGGRGGGLPALASAEIYDPQRNQWQPAGSMASPRFGAGAVLLPDGKVLVAGGSDGVDYLSSAEIFDPSNTSQLWRAAPSMWATRYAGSAAVLPDGRVLLAGGSSVFPLAEIFDPASSTWSPTPDMAGGPRYFFQTISLDDGRVMVTGGIGASFLSSAEIFDPALGPEGQWMAAGADMSMSRYLAGATQLLDGQVLVVGGFGQDVYGGFGVTNTAETFLPCPPNLAPVAVCANQVVNTGPNATTCEAAAVSVNYGSYDPENEPLSLWQMPAVGDLIPVGDTLATLTAWDGYLGGVCQATITVVDNTPPQIDCPTTQIVECQSLGNTASEGQGSAIFEDSVTSTDNCSQATTTCTLSGQRLPLGDYPVTCTSTDQAQNTATCEFTATVADTLPPVAGGSRDMVLWPANSGLVEVTLQDCAEHAIDQCRGFMNLRTNGRITYITSDEPEDAPGAEDGTTSNDMYVKKTWLALLRAERNSTGNGRVYTVHYRVTDDPANPDGRYTDSSCKVYVPINNGTPVVDDTPAYCVEPLTPVTGAGCP